jgi:hypothetical protein
VVRDGGGGQEDVSSMRPSDLLASSLAREKIGMESELFYIKTWRLC